MSDAPTDRPVMGPAEEKLEKPVWSWKNRFWIWVNTLVMSLLLLAIVVGANVVANKFYRRYDITGDKTYEISDYTLDTLRKLKKSVTIYQMPVMAYETEPFLQEISEKVSLLLQEYAAHNANIRLVKINPQESDLMIKIKQEVDTININDILFRSNDKKIKVVNLRDTYHAETNPKRIRVFKGEAVFTGAIREVTSGEKIKVYFETGHGEPDPRSFEEDIGLSKFTRGLEERGNCTIQTISLLTEKDVPADCEVLIVVFPSRPFSNPALDAMRKYLNGGGRLLVAYSHNLRGDPKTWRNLTGLERLLEEFGVQLYHRDKSGLPVADVIWEKQGLDIGLPEPLPPSFARIIDRQGYSPHRINNGMSKMLTLLPYASTVRQAGKVPDHVTTQFLLKAPDTAWDEIHPDQLSDGRYNPGVDPKGDLTMALAAEMQIKPPAPKEGQAQDSKPKRSRMVVIGSSLFFSNLTSQFRGMVSNLDYGVNCIKWLAEREEEIPEIQPKRFSDEPIDLKDEKMRAKFERGWWICGLIVPCLGIILGITAWILRRK